MCRCLGFQPGIVSTPYPNLNQSVAQSMNVVQEIMFSGKHNGLCLYLARILRYRLCDSSSRFLMFCSWW